jgi:DNA-binding transcriptional MerR regulator
MKRSAYLESVTRVPNRLQLTCVHDFRFSKKMSNDGQMREFDWKNDDVKEVLQKLRDKRMTLTEVEKFLRESYNQKMCRASIYSHCPATPAADVYLPGNDVLRLQTKFDKSMLGIKDGERYRKYQKLKSQYACIDCMR